MGYVPRTSRDLVPRWTKAFSIAIIRFKFGNSRSHGFRDTACWGSSRYLLDDNFLRTRFTSLLKNRRAHLSKISMELLIVKASAG